MDIYSNNTTKDKSELKKQVLTLVFAVTMLGVIAVTSIYIKPTLTSTITPDKLVVQQRKAEFGHKLKKLEDNKVTLGNLSSYLNQH